jgi:phage terminase small subunit
MPRMSPEARQAAQNVLVLPMSRPEPPPRLTEEQAKSWREIVERMPPNWFLPEALPVLEAYCVQITRQREVTAELNATKAKGFSNHRFKLLREENVGVKTLLSLATKLRLTPQSTVSKNKQKPVVPMRKPWEDEG